MPTCTFIGSIIDGVFQVSASLLRAYSEAGIGVVLAAGRGHSEPVQIFPAARGQVGLRLAQYRCHADSSQRLVLARKLVMGKIEHQALWLKAHGGDARLKHFAEGASQAPDLATLMGMERAASARYFAVWGTLWQVPWSFNGRNRRPPRDPINALLSLGYALALKLCRPNGGIAWVGPGERSGNLSGKRCMTISVSF
jgi:CRISP-associated protein Cas1